MKIRAVFQIAFICIFGITGWNLFDIKKQVELHSPELKDIESNNRLVFSDGSGIDIMENEIYSAFEDKTVGIKQNVIAFLLRYKSLEADVKFWNEVNSILSEHDTVHVRMIAYCENSRCIEALRKNPETVHFTVLEYGGILDMQAVIAADKDGELWLLGSGVKKIRWRDEIQTPFDVAMSIGLGE